MKRNILREEKVEEELKRIKKEKMSTGRFRWKWEIKIGNVWEERKKETE